MFSKLTFVNNDLVGPLSKSNPTGSNPAKSNPAGFLQNKYHTGVKRFCAQKYVFFGISLQVIFSELKMISHCA